jgi:PAS domain S-box-containing protein
MNEIAKVVLENEMDLILAHKQTMRLAELASLSLPAQTTFATAVSEVSRNSIEQTKDSVLRLFVSAKDERQKYLIATIQDSRTEYSEKSNEGYKYASKLVSQINVTTTDNDTLIELRFKIPTHIKIDDALIEKWRSQLNDSPAVSPYEEIKRKNRQLVDMANKLRESEQQYRTLTNSMPIMIYTRTRDGVYSYVNDWLTSYTGKTKEELTEKRWKGTIHEADYERIVAHVETECSKGTHLIDIECRLLEKSSGEYKWHKGVATALTSEGGEVTCWNGFLVDIHAEKLMEQAYRDNKQLKHAQQELESKVVELNSSNRQLEQFAYIASHDLQEPLRKIGYYSDVISTKYREHLGADGVGLFDKMVRSTDRMKLLIRDVLAYSSINSSQEFESVDLNAVLQDALSDLEIAITEKNAIIDHDKLPVIDGNFQQLKQLFENLLSNSLKFTAGGIQPRITISAATDKGYLSLSFKDNGIGFDETYLNRMFDLFQRLHTRDKYLGTGIGLAICKKIVTLHNGVITAHSGEGEGATFLVKLPMAQDKNS